MVGWFDSWVVKKNTIQLTHKRETTNHTNSKNIFLLLRNDFLDSNLSFYFLIFDISFLRGARASGYFLQKEQKINR
jgi:hypothetical protein